jgi:hypothetical protein
VYIKLFKLQSKVVGVRGNTVSGVRGNTVSVVSGNTVSFVIGNTVSVVSGNTVSVAPHIKDQISDDIYVQIIYTCENYIPGQQISQKETG